jgi:hypothetical protein
MMNTRRLFGFVSLVLASALLGGCASTPRAVEAVEWDGLVRQPHARLNAVFVRPGIKEQMSGFQSVILDPVDVSFASEFENVRRTGRISRDLNAADLAAIQRGLADQFQQVFREELQGGGYQIVDTAGPETLRVSAAIVDLFIAAPEAAQPIGRGNTYTANAGRMTLVLEMRESVTGEILVRAVDARSGRDSGMWTVTNRATNTAEARRAMRTWARALREGLDEFNARSAPGAAN